MSGVDFAAPGAPAAPSGNELHGRVLFLGTGTSFGVPMIGCDCPVCTSDDPRNARSRASVVVHVAGTSILIDTTPDLRAQALRHRLCRIDAVLFTHAHADHIFGFDDLRGFNRIQEGPIPCYADAVTARRIRRAFAYVFGPPGPGGGAPRVRLEEIADDFHVGAIPVRRVPVLHGPRCISAFRIGRFAYAIDASGIPAESLAQLAGLDVLVLNALRPEPHATHLSITESVALAREIGARRTYLSGLAHLADHAALSASLPDGIEVACDGLEVTF